MSKKRKIRHQKKLKLGLALGAGGARGFTHIGVLKVLHEAGMQPQILAGTSMGAVIGALYASGKFPEEIEELVQNTRWKEMLDVTIPKTGFLKGNIVEEYLRQVLREKQFHQLKIPFHAVAYNLTKRKQVIFSAGDVARAVRASISIPGVFSPLKIKKEEYVDGAVANPTPFDIVRQQGADVVIAVDLFPTTAETVSGPLLQKSSFLRDIEREFVAEELRQVKKLIFPEAWPPFLRRVLVNVFDKLLYPARILRVMTGQELPPIGKVMLQTMNVLMKNLAHARLQCAVVEVKVTPSFGKLTWKDFDKAEEFIRIGEVAMKKELPRLKKLMRRS